MERKQSLLSAGSIFAGLFVLSLLAGCDSRADSATGGSADTTSGPVSTTPSDTTSTIKPATSNEATTIPAPLDPPYFEYGPCVTEAANRIASDPARNIECGQLVVLEDRTRPEGNLVRLPVVIARTQHPNPAPDPVIYLAGGGGHNHLRYADFLQQSVGDAVLEQRDFIQYNQRGAPLTSPELSCPGLPAFLYGLAAQELSQEEWADRHLEFLARCRQTLVATGIDLSMYNSAANAADADDLRRALGYEQANYYGTSYGTRLGLDLIRDYPAGVRSVILDSVYPPQAEFYTESGANLQRALTYLFTACNDDKECAGAYPDLETSFYETVARLDVEPVWVDSPKGRILVDGGIFMDAVSLYLYSPSNITRIPDAISRAAVGDISQLAGPVAGAITTEDIAWAMWYSMQCREEIPFESLDAAVEMGASLAPGVAAHYVDGFAKFHFALCEEWGLEPTDVIESRAVMSDTPALVLAGSYDPVTPPAWSESTATALENAFYYEFPHVGHGIMRSTSCGLSIGLQFLDDPHSEPDTSCLAGMPPPKWSR